MVATWSNSEESSDDPSEDDDVANLGLMVILDNDI